MPCNLIGGYVVPCNKDSIGGLASVVMGSFSDLSSITETDGVITAITMKPGKCFYDFKLTKATSFFVSTPTTNVQNGSLFFAESLTLVFNRLRASTSNLVQTLAANSLLAIVKDQNGEFVLLGRSYGLDLSGGSAGSGTAAGDRNGYELQFSGEEAKISHVDPTIIAGLLVPGTAETFYILTDGGEIIIDDNNNKITF